MSNSPDAPLYKTALRDFLSGFVVFVVALPLCLGIALAAGAPVFSGILGGIIGGVLVGLLSGSRVSVSGPGNTMVAVAAAQMAVLGSFEAFLLAVLIAGGMQLALGLARAGSISAFIPTSVVKGLLAAIGIVLILKQIPHLLGYDVDPTGEFYFFQPDQETTFSELAKALGAIHPGAAAVGVASVVFLVAWGRVKWLKQSIVPEQLLVVLLGVGLSLLLTRAGGSWVIGPDHLVQVPIAETWSDFLGFLRFPDYSQWSNPAIYRAAVTIVLVASLETLLSLEAIYRIDPQKRPSPPNRELCAQGIGNMTAGLLGGLPVSSVIIRGSINISSGAQTKLSTMTHGLLILASVVFAPALINKVPMSCLAAILLVAGFKLTSPSVFREMWSRGWPQFLPFVATVLAIIFSDLLVGVIVGLVVAVSFILASNVRQPIRRSVENHVGSEVLRIELANQVSFLNRAALNRTLEQVPRGGHVLLDARNTRYIDPDVLELLRDFEREVAPAHGVEVSFLGFRDKYEIEDQIQYLDYSTRDVQESHTPAEVLAILKEGHDRFRAGRPLTRDLARQVNATAHEQHPLAVVLGCIDSRTPAELIFDVGIGDIFVVRVAGNVTSPEVLGSLEFSCLAGAKLILVLGHTRCSAVASVVDALAKTGAVDKLDGYDNVDSLLKNIRESITDDLRDRLKQARPHEHEHVTNEVARRNVEQSVARILESSAALRALVSEGRLAIVGAMYDVVNGEIAFLSDGSTLSDAGSG
ncbi:MAG: sulfate transporter [Planctomycetota bacterium]|nr:MAG: sulfate transporter [Planctomycetota bacterium]